MSLLVVMILSLRTVFPAVLLRLAEECCQTDTQLMLGYLFSLPQVVFVKFLQLCKFHRQPCI